MRTSTIIGAGVIAYLLLRPKASQAKPKPGAQPSAKDPLPPPPEERAVPPPKQPAFGNVPPGFSRKYYYGTHWVYEYPQNPPARRYWLSFFSGAQGWSSNENELRAS